MEREGGEKIRRNSREVMCVDVETLDPIRSKIKSTT